MRKIGIKFEKVLDYERYEPLQHWLDFDFEYEDLEAYVTENRVIELELEEDEDREEDILMLKAFLNQFENDEVAYEIFVMNNDWEKIALNAID